MNLTRWSVADLQALRAFYDAGQAFTFADIEAGSSQLLQGVQDWLVTSPPPRRFPVLLPACPVSVREPCWYAIAFSSSQAEQLRRELVAFIGMAGTDFAGHRVASDPTDRVLQAAANWAGGEFVFRFSVHLPASRSGVRTALDRLRQIWRMRPDLGVSSFRTSDALLREFTAALAAQDASGSESWLQAIRQSGRLSIENLRFLEIERLGSLGYWDQLALHPQLSLLITIRRPRRITAWLIEALWHSEFARFFDSNQPAAALSHMRGSFLKRYEALFRTRAGLSEPKVVLLFLLVAAASTHIRNEQIPLLLAALPVGTIERAFAECIVAEVAVPPTPPSTLSEVKRLLLEEDYDTAWSHLMRSEPSIEVVQCCFDRATEINTPEAAQSSFRLFDSLSSDDRGRILRQRRYAQQRAHLESIVTGPSLIRNWDEWTDKLMTDPTWSQAAQTARIGANDWRLEEYEHDLVRVSQLVARLQTVGTVSPLNVRLAVPSIVAFFLRSEESRPAFMPIWEWALLVLAVDNQFGGSDWTLTQALTGAIFEAGPTPGAYIEVVEELKTIWDSRGEPARLDWALDHLDLLVTSPALDATARESFFHSVHGSFVHHARRIASTQRELFRVLCADLGHQDAFAALPTPSRVDSNAVDAGGMPSLKDKIVAIYSLTESAAARAKYLIEVQFPEVDVRLSHEHVGSPRLAALAREADYFLVVAKSAKHAATDFLKANRRGRSDLIYPSGRGSSSIVSALLDLVRAGS